MCGDKDCGTFRVYTTSDHSAKDMWLQTKGSGTNGTTPLAAPGDIFPVGSGPARAEADAKFMLGNEGYWAKPWHFGADCPEGCHCVRTTEKVSEESVLEERSWRQAMDLTEATGHVGIVVRGTYKIKFQDFKGKCDVNDEVGKPIG